MLAAGCASYLAFGQPKEVRGVLFCLGFGFGLVLACFFKVTLVSVFLLGITRAVKLGTLNLHLAPRK